jgi:hypothetical protein
LGERAAYVAYRVQLSVGRKTNFVYIHNKQTRKNIQTCTVRRKTFAWLAQGLGLRRGLSNDLSKFIWLADPLLGIEPVIYLTSQER